MTAEPQIILEVKKILEEFGTKYLTENGNLKKSKIIDDLENYDKKLIKKMCDNKYISNTYIEKIEGISVFKINQFLEMFEYKKFWEDSYTSFSNKIGLSTDNKFIEDNLDVVLNFPFKDTVLKAGMVSEDEDKVKETFLNETIAKSEIDELFEPKVLVKAKKYDTNGSHDVSDFSDEDNLIVKGNNLIALHSLKKRYAGKIKLIYLDPPYNTGKGFNYNDRFTKSSWLTFMKSRLEIAKTLLKEDGLIFVNIDSSRANSQSIKGTTMAPYLHVLMDEIFNAKNYIGTLAWKKKKQPSFLSRIASVLDHIIVFSKNESKIKKLSISTTTDTTKRVDNSSNSISSRRILKGIQYRGKESNLVIKAGTYKSKTMSVTYLKDLVIQNGRTINDVTIEARWRTNQENITKYCEKDLLYINSYKTLRRDVEESEKTEKSITDLLLDWGQNQDGTSEIKELFGEKVFDTPKPEKLLKNIIQCCTKENDIVLDFFMGSATTQSVAMKMKRRFIGIEQMNYFDTISIPRLEKVIGGEQGGVSKELDWSGGGSFVKVELMQKNQIYVDEIVKADNIKELNILYNKIKNIDDIDFKVDLEKFDSEKDSLSYEDMKKLLLKILDKNQLYCNVNNIGDKDILDKISHTDFLFNKSFYDMGDDIL